MGQEQSPLREPTAGGNYVTPVKTIKPSSTVISAGMSPGHFEGGGERRNVILEILKSATANRVCNEPGVSTTAY